MIEGVSHITFIVSDLDRSERLLIDALDAHKVYDSGDTLFSVAPERFFLIGGQWIAIMQGDPLQSRTYHHVAFKIKDEHYKSYLDRLVALDVEVQEGRSRVQGEGRSIYFYDYDNHLFELHTATLTERLERYRLSRNSGNTAWSSASITRA